MRWRRGWRMWPRMRPALWPCGSGVGGSASNLDGLSYAERRMVLDVLGVQVQVYRPGSVAADGTPHPRATMTLAPSTGDEAYCVSPNTLMHRGWVERVPNASAYRLSIKFLALAHVVTQDRSFLKEVRPALEALSTLCRETVHVGVLDGLEILHVDKIDSLERVGVASKIGSRGPAHTASLGKALLAASSDQAVEEYIARATAGRGPVRLADPEAFREEIALTRRRGYAIDDEEDAPGVRCLGVAIRGAGGAPLFAISLTGPSARFTLERVAAAAPRVVEIARQLSLRLGWEPEPEGILH